MVYGKHKRKTLEKQNKRSLISGRIGLQSCFIIFKLKQKNQMERHGYCNFFLQNGTFIFQTINGKPISSNCFSRSVDMFPFR